MTRRLAGCFPRGTVLFPTMNKTVTYKIHVHFSQGKRLFINGILYMRDLQFRTLHASVFTLTIYTQKEV